LPRSARAAARATHFSSRFRDLPELIRAAGGIVVENGRVLLVHRPRYDDWSLPKGKLEAGESWEQAALREVEEETGVECELGAYAGTARYEVAGAPKEVRYYLMTPAGRARAQNEVDEVRWVPLAEAPELLTHERDRLVLQQAL
jgi:ADP-ribose pyrophosphatase YjhB (NUDIX family)